MRSTPARRRWPHTKRRMPDRTTVRARNRLAGGSCGYLYHVSRPSFAVARLANRNYVNRLGVIAMLIMSGGISAINAHHASVKTRKATSPYCGTDNSARLLRNTNNLNCALRRAIRGSAPSGCRYLKPAVSAVPFSHRSNFSLLLALSALGTVGSVDSPARRASADLCRPN